MFFCKSDARAIAPRKVHPTDSGWDFFALEDTVIRPGEILRIPTGIRLNLRERRFDPEKLMDLTGLGGFIFDKSGRGAAGLKTFGGVIDNPYLGNVDIVVGNLNLWSVLELLRNPNATPADFGIALDKARITVPYGKALAQLVLLDPQLEQNRLDELDERDFDLRFSSDRGQKGFSSSDKAPSDVSEVPTLEVPPKIGHMRLELLREINEGTLLEKPYTGNPDPDKPTPYRGPQGFA